MITLASLPQATAQEVFDQVSRHLLTQNEKSVRGQLGCNCSYRGTNGLKCAAGCLISDDEYNPKIDSEEIGVTGWHELVDLGYVPSDHRYLIVDLQFAHDFHKPSDWPRQLELVARRHHLNTEVLQCASSS